MRVQSPIQVEFEKEDEVEDVIQSLVDANNKNSNNFSRGFGDITFSENIRAKVVEVSVITGEAKTVRHSLGFTPGFWVPVCDSRVFKLVKNSYNTKQISLTFYLFSSSLTADVVASKDLYVLNPYIFIVGDSVRVGGTEYLVEAVDISARKVSIDTAINASQFDLVELYRDTVKVLVA